LRAYGGLQCRGAWCVVWLNAMKSIRTLLLSGNEDAAHAGHDMHANHGDHGEHGGHAGGMIGVHSKAAAEEITRGLDARVGRVVPGYMTMGATGIGEMHAMERAPRGHRRWRGQRRRARARRHRDLNGH
jgi:hypothetical protein